MTEDKTIHAYPLLGEIYDLRETKITTIKSFIHELKIHELQKTERLYSRLPFKLYLDHDSNEVTLKLEAPWRLPSDYKHELAQVIGAYGYITLANDQSIREKCIDDVINWFQQFIIKIQQLEYRLSSTSYISVFALWDYIYGIMNYTGDEQLNIEISNLTRKENELTCFLKNITCYDSHSNRISVKDGILHMRVNPFVDVITIDSTTSGIVRLISEYEVYWAMVNLNTNVSTHSITVDKKNLNPYIYLEILDPKNGKSRLKYNLLITMNFYDHFNWTHFHQFKNEHEFKRYLYEKIFKSWNGRLNNIPMQHDRLYHGVISNLELWLSTNEPLNLDYYRELRKQFQYLHVLQGLFPIMYTQKRSFKDFVALIDTLLDDDQIQKYLLDIWHSSNLEFNQFPMLSDMADFLGKQRMRYRFRLKSICILNVPVETVTFMPTMDVIHYRFKINKVGYPSYADPNPCNYGSYKSETQKVRFRYGIWANDISKIYTLQFGETIHAPDHVSDDEFLEIIKREFQYRELYKVDFARALDPQRLLASTGYKDSAYKFNYMDKVIMQSYCYEQNVSYMDVKGQTADVNIIAGDINTDYNSSTLKLLQLFVNTMYDATSGWDFLTQPLNILILGGVTEPLVKVLKRLSNDQYKITVIGRQAYSPFERADLENIILNKNFDAVISDVDQTDVGTVEEICNKFTNHVVRIDGLAAIVCIIKCNYPLEGIYLNLTNINRTQKLYTYKLVHSAVSPIGSYEIYFTGSGERTTNKVYPISDIVTYKNLLTQPLDPFNITMYKFLRSIPSQLPPLRGNDLNSILGIGGSVFSILCDKEHAASIVGTLLSISSKVVYGNTRYRSTDSSIRISGVVNYARLCFTKLVGNFGTIFKENFINTGGYYPVNDDVIIQSSSPGKSFGYGQRFALLLVLGSVDLPSDNKIEKVYDIGCRDYESIIISGILTNLKLYAGYDVIPNNLVLPLTSKVTFTNQFIHVASLKQMMTDAKQTLFICYNSLFMNLNTKSELLNGLKDILTLIGDVITSKEKYNSYFAFSLYICEPELIDQYKLIGKVENQGDDIYFTLDQGDPVPTLTSVEFLNIVAEAKVPADNVTLMVTTKEMICVGSSIHGFSPNFKSLSLNYLYNGCQPLIIVSY